MCKDGTCSKIVSVLWMNFKCFLITLHVILKRKCRGEDFLDKYDMECLKNKKNILIVSKYSNKCNDQKNLLW